MAQRLNKGLSLIDASEIAASSSTATPDAASSTCAARRCNCNLKALPASEPRVSVEFTDAEGKKEVVACWLFAHGVTISSGGRVALGDSFSELTQLRSLDIEENLFTEIPTPALTLPLKRFYVESNPITSISSSVAHLSQLTSLGFSSCPIVAVAPELFLLTRLREMCISITPLASLSPQIASLQRLTFLDISSNRLQSLPAELGQLDRLAVLDVCCNQLRWLPRALDDLPAKTSIRAAGNLLHIDAGGEFDSIRSRLAELFAATPVLLPIRDRATEICLALQDLALPALVTLEIIDAVFDREATAIRMAAKWDLVTAVKHWHERQVET